MSPGHRWTLDEYLLRCEQLSGLREVVVEGELDRDFISDALSRYGLLDVTTIDADYVVISDEDIEAAGFTAGVKGQLLTLAAAINAVEDAGKAEARIAVIVDRDYEELSMDRCLLVTDGYSIESFALSAEGLERFSKQVLGRADLPAGRDGQAPDRRRVCTGEDLYERVIGALAEVAGIRLALRSLEPPIGLFDSWLDYFKISTAGRIEDDSITLLRNVVMNSRHREAVEGVEQAAAKYAARATEDPVRLVRGRDFVELLAKLMTSTWGRRRGGDRIGDVGRLKRLLVFAVDSKAIDASALMGGLRQRFAG